MKSQHVFLVLHDPRWAAAFARESSAVAASAGPALVAIHHIGSTAIPGIPAKPIIDMLAVTGDLALLDQHTSRINALGYESLGEFGIPGRRYYRKNNPAGERTHQIHAFQIGSPQIARHLAFRDYLKAHPDIAREYAVLKHRLASSFPNDIESYTDGKDTFIHKIDLKAAAWLAETRHAGKS